MGRLLSRPDWNALDGFTLKCVRWDSCFMSHSLTGSMASNSAAVHANMKRVSGGTFRMGSDHHYPEEAPAHLVTVDPFWIDTTPVTNRQFAEFVRATGHVTFAETVPDPKDYPGSLPHMIFAGSLVFTPPKHQLDLGD